MVKGASFNGFLFPSSATICPMSRADPVAFSPSLKRERGED